MVNKPYAFLGQYLLGNRLITEDQLDEAIRLQGEHNPLVGTIALNRGLLDDNQLNHLIKRQIQVDERIGTLAVQEGFMTDDQLESVLSDQAGDRMLLGESLVHMGAISDVALKEAANDFENNNAAREQQVRDELGHLPTARELLITLDVTLRFFYRLGYVIHLVGKCDTPPDYVEYLFCSEQRLEKEDARYMGVGMSGTLVVSIARSSKLREHFDRPSPDAMKNMSQLVFNLNYMACEKLQERGIQAKHGAAFLDEAIETATSGVCVEIETVAGPMVFAYSDKAPASMLYLF